jgi:hypothetical protein
MDLFVSKKETYEEVVDLFVSKNLTYEEVVDLIDPPKLLFPESVCACAVGQRDQHLLCLEQLRQKSDTVTIPA